MGTLRELIDAERRRVQDLRTRFVVAKAFQDELDARTHGRVLEFANTMIRQMVSDHRYGLTARVAGWVRAATSDAGFFDHLARSHLSELLRQDFDDLDEDYLPVLGADTIRKSFEARFPGVAAGAVPLPVDIEILRTEIRNKATTVMAHASALQRHFEDGATSTALASLDEIDVVIRAAEDILGDLANFAGVVDSANAEDLTPDPKDAARDLVDLELIGTIDRLVMLTGANDRLGASGAWWWQYRQEFWDAVEQASQGAPTSPINALEVVRAARSRSRPLTTPQIERLVTRYRLEYARYDATARSVEEKLRKMLGRERVKALIASRAKDLESFRGKLLLKQAKYDFADLDADLGSVVTDLAGVRVILYDDQDTERVAALIKDTWSGCADEPHDTQYQARHLTVVVADPDSRSIDGAKCEIQLTSLSAHAFNELEHDIRYKDHDVPAGQDVRDKLEMLRHTTGGLQLVIRQLLTARKEELGAGKTQVMTGMDLGAVLDGLFQRRVTGDFDALLYLWQGAEQETLTRPLVAHQAYPLLVRGRSLVAQSADDATTIAFALFADSQDELRDIARGYPNQDSALIRAILEASALENA